MGTERKEHLGLPEWFRGVFIEGVIFDLILEGDVSRVNKGMSRENIYIDIELWGEMLE